MKKKGQAIEELLQLRLVAKFESDDSVSYPGLENESMKGTITHLVNQCIDDFIVLVKNNAREEDFQQAISKGLSYFETVKFSLDTEDRERVCRYFEEMMDAIELESSGGLLNEWMYGFDPTGSPSGTS